LMDYQVFSSLLRSMNCNPCFLFERGTAPSFEEEIMSSNQGIRRMVKEISELPLRDLGIHIFPFADRDRLDRLMARIDGPKDSPYENGIFYLMVTYSISDFGFTAPKIRFLTKIFHPAISCHGFISVDMLAREWTPVLTMRTILLSIQSLLTDTDFELCEDNPIGKLFKENKPEYEKIARIWTDKYAMQHLIYPPPPQPPPLEPAPIESPLPEPDSPNPVENDI